MKVKIDAILIYSRVPNNRGGGGGGGGGGLEISPKTNNRGVGTIGGRK